MPHYGLLGDYQFRDAAEDIRGTTLYGFGDEKLGKIEDVIFDHSTGDIDYVVVDTGWLTTKQFIVPADSLRYSAKHDHDFACDLTKQQVESFPPYSDSHLESPDQWGDYEGRYRSKWETGPVMHREGTDRNITPTTQQLEGNRSSTRAAGGGSVPMSPNGALNQEEDLVAADSPTGRVVPAGSDSVIISNSAVGIGGRFDTFQDRLRERRKEAVAGCGTCTINVSGTKGSEGSDTLKKAG